MSTALTTSSLTTAAKAMFAWGAPCRQALTPVRLRGGATFALAERYMR
jgi:hypothetical protein